MEHHIGGVVVFFFLIEVHLIYSVVLISGVQQSESAIHLSLYIYIFFFRFFSIIGYYTILSRVPRAIQ